MKRALVLGLMLLSLSAIAFAGPSLNPWFEINVPGIVQSGPALIAPTLDAGVTIEGMLSPSWFIDLGVTYSDPNMLRDNNPISLDFESNIGFDELVTVDTTGSLAYGCTLSFMCDTTYKVKYPKRLKLIALEPGFMAEGYVGPLTVWGGLSLPWNGSEWLKFVPSFGLRVDFEIEL